MHHKIGNVSQSSSRAACPVLLQVNVNGDVLTIWVPTEEDKQPEVC